MFWYLCAYVLFMIGAVLGLTQGAAEPSLWLISMGWVLEVTLILLRALGSTRVKELPRAGWQKAAQALALTAVPVMMYFRLKADLKRFELLLISAALLWSLALLRNKTS
ncbi:MAG TPA: hypothetical protein PKL82_04080 [Anaerolineaceae bacterium]|jgi:hypothetical protein|nr:hypothetical protein [Anaerolineaceae bacterium]NMD27278.1 hypothetical protein [Chloroflexota bacterium]HOA21650.1 hypothetical protein [Anaerolineaceae bacterium]